MTSASTIRADADFLLHEPHDDRASHFSVMDLLTHQANIRPAAILFAETHGARPASFAQAHDAVSRLSGFFRALKLPAGSSAGLIMAGHAHASIGLLACLEAGLEPLLLSPRYSFSDFGGMIARKKCAILVADQSAHADIPAMAARLAAAHDCVRFVAAFGASLPNGVIALESAMRAQPMTDSSTVQISRIAVPGKDRAVSTLHIDALLASATEHAAETAMEPAARVVCPLPFHTPAALCTGLFSALLTGAELHGLDAPDSAMLTAALLSPRPCHLIWPGALEDMLDDVPVHALKSVTIIHHLPWEKQAHRACQPIASRPLVDGWVFSDRLIAFAGRGRNEDPALPLLKSARNLRDMDGAFALHRDEKGALLAAGACVQGYDPVEPQWIALHCRAFLDHHGALVALEPLPASPISKQRAQP